MKIYEQGKDFIRILDPSSFNIEHILECGQVFCFDKVDGHYLAFPQDKYAEIFFENGQYLIKTSTPDFFVKWFDLDKDYGEIKKALNKFPIMSKPIKFGYGIRILNQNLFETLISFIISANNNIKRIKSILLKLREALGEKTSNGYAFPSREKMLEKDEAFYKNLGVGYRASYIVKVLRQVDEKILEEWRGLDTGDLRNHLIALAGVGPKVADCVLLFGYHKGDVFPVDTWIEQMYNENFSPLKNRNEIRDNLTKMFGGLSGYAQQYLFYYQRSFLG